MSVNVKRDDYNLASSILLGWVDEIHVKKGDVVTIEFDGDDELLDQFNKLMDAAHVVIKKVSERVTE
jgi:hypothetical protein